MTNIYILVGCPASGKSTLAQGLLQHHPDCRLIATDKIRAGLWGDEAIQGPWQPIEREVFRQVKNYISIGYSIIYDATNAERRWREDFLQKLTQFEGINPMALHLKTPLEVCKQWNQHRPRQVPEGVIDECYQALQRFPPLTAEGFTAVYAIEYKQGTLSYPAEFAQSLPSRETPKMPKP